MKKTKFIVMAAFAAMFGMCFTACTNSEEEVANAKADYNIGFSVHGENAPGTRGYATTAANALNTITSFATWAYDDTTDGLYMGTSASAGRVVSNADPANPAWTYSPTQFWPVNPLNFVAITPSSDASITSTSTASATNVVTLTAGVTLSTDVEAQKDIMMAKADGITKATSGANVPFTFEHALSQIVFKGQFDDQRAVTKVTIAEISLCNINKSGTLVYTSEGTWYGGTLQDATANTEANFTLDSDDLEGYIFDVDDVLTPAVLYTAEDPEAIADPSLVGTVKTPAVTRGTTAFDLTISENSSKKNAWMMIPQTTTAWAGPAAVNATPASGSYLKIRAQLEKDGVVILGSAAADALYIPLAANWDRSKKYTYTIIFNGASALTPITFSVAAEDWTDGGNTNKNM